MGLTTTCFLASQFLLVAMAHSKGIHQGGFLLSAVGITDMLTRLASGVLFNISAVQRHQHYFYISSIALLSLSVFLWAILSDFISILVVAIIHGMAVGMITAQRAAMTADLVGVKRISSSFGLIVFVQGIGLLAGPAFAGTYLTNYYYFLLNSTFIILCD